MEQQGDSEVLRRFAMVTQRAAGLEERLDRVKLEDLGTDELLDLVGRLYHLELECQEVASGAQELLARRSGRWASP